MANNEVKLTIRINDNGGLDVVAKKAEAAAKATGKVTEATGRATKAKNEYNKLEKGTAQLGANTTKSFAKQAQIVGNGLVPAYATLAANVFAITAAFNALRGADQSRLLAEGLDQVGDAAGRNLPYLANRLKEITGSAISTQQAMEQVALATSSGFSQEQIEGLAKVASGASKALGRDMGDALSRLTRGVAKLEPEILDELGIMVRLDDAATTYGASIGKTADQLTTLERRQAFANAVLEQGLEKFGRLADSVDPSAYDQLAAAFDELSKGFLNIINVGVTPLLNLLAGNQGALVGATVLFGSTIGRQMVPALYEGAKAAEESAKALASQAEEIQSNISTTGNLPKVYKNLSTSIQEGTASQGDFDSALNSLNRSVTLHTSQLEGMIQREGEESKAVTIKKEKLGEVTQARKTLITTMSLQRQASAQTAASNAIEAASQLNLKSTIDFLKIAYQEKMAAEILAAKATGTTITGLTKLKVAFFTAGISAKAFGAALLQAIPIIGQIILVVSLVIDFVIDWLSTTDEMTVAANNAAESLGNFGDAYKDLQNRLSEDGASKLIEESVTLNGVFGEISARFTELKNKAESLKSDKLKELNEEITKTRQALAGTLEHESWWDAITDPNSYLGVLTLNNRLKDLTEERDKALEKKTNIGIGEEIGAYRTLLTSAITNLEVFGDSTEFARAQLEEFLNNMTEETEVKAIESVLNELGSVEKQIVTALENSKSSFAKFQEEVAKFDKKQTTPFDDIVTQVTNLQEAIDGVSVEDAKQAIINELGPSFTKVFGNSAEAVNNFKTKLEEARKNIRDIPGEIQKLEFSVAKLKKASKESSEALEDQLTSENKITENRIKALESERTAINLVTATTDEKQRVKEIIAEIAALEEKIVSQEVINAEVAIVQVKEKQKLLGIDQKIAAANRAIFESQAKSRRIMAEMATLTRDPTSRDTGVSARQERDIFEEEKGQRIALALSEHELKKQAIEMEYDLLDAQAQLLKIRLDEADKDTTGINNYIKNLGAAEQAANDAADKALANALAEIALQSTRNQAAVETAALAAAGQGSSTSERLGNFSKEGGFSSFDTVHEKVAAAREALQPMIDDIKKLGPEGELVAAIAEGSFVIASSFSKAFESGAKGMEKAAAVAQAVGDTIGAVNSIMQAGIQATIAKIDDEIAAEKKRDGKSAESVARIQALEKKKEQQARKAFETNKKMMIAQAIASTAAGVMGALGSKPWGPWNFALAALVGAMGAAQVAIIASQSYQGGGGGTSTAVPSSISMGKRQSSIDLAQSRSASGELGYLRGESGTGGPENFKPAFSGMKYRAAGGTTGLVVGEQGPELFVPNRPGRIVPNDEMGAAPAQNVNFSINAVDAAGVEDLLMNQRGNIIGMLREASNSYGQPFMEKVNTQIYNANQNGAKRYGA